jgi:hypothetical protein
MGPETLSSVQTAEDLRSYRMFIDGRFTDAEKIGRASCRERVFRAV